MSNPQTPTRKIALVGGSGNLGSHILTSLLAQPHHSVTVLTRISGTATFPPSPSLTITKVDYSSDTAIVNALRGHDFLIITLSARAPTDLHPRIVNAAAETGVKYVVPNYYGYPLRERGGSATSDALLSGFGRFIDDVKSVEAKEVRWSALCCGFWYEYSLGMGQAWFGFDVAARKVTFYDDGLTKINTSTWSLCGSALAALVSLPDPSLDNFTNISVNISSFLVSQRDMLESLHRVLSTSDQDWEITYQSSAERYEEGVEEFKEGKREGIVKAMYARVFKEGGRGDYETGRVLDNGRLGLEVEGLDEATKRVVGMVKEGFGRKG